MSAAWTSMQALADCTPALFAWVEVAQAGVVFRDWDDPAQLGRRCLAIALLVLLNGFFVAAEYSLVRVPKNAIEALADSGKKSSRLLGEITGRLDAYLSACQLGITIASLALGWVGQPLVARLLQPLLAMTSWSELTIWWLSVGIAFAIVVFLHVVIGELIPKAIALHAELRTAQWVARPLRGFYLLFCWPIALLNWTADLIARVVLRIDVQADRERIHSGEELRVLVEQTEQGEDVTETEREILINALELNDLTVRDIMTPRADVVTLDVEKTFEENVQVAIQSKHTRFPLVSGHLDNTIGLIHVKDVVGLSLEEAPDLERIRRDIISVEELMPLDTLLKTFLSRHAHVALVKDEFGGSLGLVMLDDVLEELVGTIQDEFDEADDGFHQLSEDEFIAAGSLPLHDLADESGLVVERSDVSTIGGYVTHVIGHLPKVGEKLLIGNYEATVTLADERTVQEVRFRRLVGQDGEDDAKANGSKVGPKGEGKRENGGSAGPADGTDDDARSAVG